jgi:hypothetical protein
MENQSFQIFFGEDKGTVAPSRIFAISNYATFGQTQTCTTVPFRGKSGFTGIGPDRTIHGEKPKYIKPLWNQAGF